MRRSLTLAIFVCSFSTAFADGIKYKPDYKSAKGESLATGKPLVIIFAVNAKGRGC